MKCEIRFSLRTVAAEAIYPPTLPTGPPMKLLFDSKEKTMMYIQLTGTQNITVL